MLNLHIAVTESDAQTVADLWTKSSQWLRASGFDQWQYPVKWNNIAKSIERRTCWIGTIGNHPVSTITIEPHYDACWVGLVQDLDNALYIHRIVVDDAYRHMKLGQIMLKWAAQKASADGYDWIRLDAWRTNTTLQQYYKQHDFEFVGTNSDTSDPAGVCFQKPTDLLHH